MVDPFLRTINQRWRNALRFRKICNVVEEEEEEEGEGEGEGEGEEEENGHSEAVYR